MDNAEILRHVDHTLLSATATWPQIQTLCGEAVRYKTASVCVPPSFIARIKSAYGDTLNICTVIGFPLGYSTAAVKAFEAQTAIFDGADEIDMVINIGDAKQALFSEITEEIAAVKSVCGARILKVIIETCYLTEQEKIALCNCVTQAKADFIKTSTGFGTGGAALSDVALFKEHIGAGIQIKAAGGIRTREDMEAYLLAGCGRLGTSAAIKILTQ